MEQRGNAPAPSSNGSGCSLFNTDFQSQSICYRWPASVTLEVFPATLEVLNMESAQHLPEKTWSGL